MTHRVPKIESVMRVQGNADIEAQAELPRHQRIGHRMHVLARVEQIRGSSRRIAEAHRPGTAIDLRHIDAVMRLEPDAIVIDDADDRNRHLEDPRRHGGDAVEGAVRRRVQNVVAPDGGEPARLIGRYQIRCNSDS